MRQAIYTEPNGVLYQGHALDKSRLGWTGIIQLLYFIKERFSPCRLLWANVRANDSIVLRNLFALAKFHKQLGLLMLNFQVRKQCLDASYSLKVGNAPCMKGLAIPSTWLFYASVALEVLRQKFNNIRSNLLQSYLFRIYRVFGISRYPHSVGAFLYREISIAVEATCQICLHSFFHESSITYSVAGCK